MKKAIFGVFGLLLLSLLTTGCPSEGPSGPGPTPTVTATPTVTGTPVCVGTYAPTPVADSGTNDSIAQAQVIPAIVQSDYYRVVTGSVSATGDVSDFYQFSDSFYTACHYTYLDCFDDGGGGNNFDLFVYDSGGTLISSYSTASTQEGACTATGAGPFTVEVRAVSGSGSYRLVFYPT